MIIIYGTGTENGLNTDGVSTETIGVQFRPKESAACQE
jgi:hypothetical protein